MGKTMAVIGGDLRQIHLARLLLEDGRDVVTWGLEHGGGPCAVPMPEALERDVLIFPLPVCRGGQLNLPLGEARPEPERLWSRIAFHRLLLGGMTGELSGRLLKDYGLTMLDYFDREELQVANAAITAEAALAMILEKLNCEITRANILILGWGRIGKCLTHQLHHLNANVTVYARKDSDRALLRALGYRYTTREELRRTLSRYSTIVNTIPAPLLTEEESTRPGCFKLELASGVWLPGEDVTVAHGLPGKCKPEASGALIAKTIAKFLGGTL